MVEHPFGVWESAKGTKPPSTPTMSSRGCYYYKGPSYPGGHFEGNQLLANSIGLSPLCPRLTIDLHVRTVADFHQSFPWLHPAQA